MNGPVLRTILNRPEAFFYLEFKIAYHIAIKGSFVLNIEA